MKFQLGLVTATLSAMVSGFTYERLDRDKAMVAIVDHQVGLLNVVHDMEHNYFREQVLFHARTAKAFDLPVVLTTSAETGPNGPLLAELREMFPDAPYIARGGEINAMDNEDFRDAIAATNRSQIIVAGIVTDICTTFAALSLVEAGYSVFANGEASGTFNVLSRELGNDRMLQGGVQILTSFAVLCELMRDWRTPPENDEVWLLIDRFLPTSGFNARLHGAAVEKGEIQDGQELLPW